MRRNYKKIVIIIIMMIIVIEYYIDESRKKRLRVFILCIVWKMAKRVSIIANDFSSLKIAIIMIKKSGYNK